MSNLLKVIKHQWLALQPRERVILSLGTLIVGFILFYALILVPWHRALNNMTASLPKQRTDLIWLRTQSEVVNSDSITAAAPKYRGQEQSLLSVLEQTANQAQVRDAIQQLVPSAAGSEVRVVLEEADFNRWLNWIDVLFKQYGVRVTQVTAEKEDERPNIAEIRVTFQR